MSLLLLFRPCRTAVIVTLIPGKACLTASAPTVVLACSAPTVTLRGSAPTVTLTAVSEMC